MAVNVKNYNRVTQSVLRLSYSLTSIGLSNLEKCTLSDSNRHDSSLAVFLCMLTMDPSFLHSKNPMAKLLFKLNGVSQEEADQIRALLDEHDVDVYETSAGRWGVSLAAIWLRDETQFEAARQLILESQLERQKILREEFDEKLASGEIPNWRERLAQRPVDFFAVGLAIVFILGLMLYPFLSIFS